MRFGICVSVKREGRSECSYTEGGWIHIEEAQPVEEALQAKERGFGGTKIKIGKPDVSEDVRRLSAGRDAVGPGWGS